jgi:hypothetical protein
VIERRRELVTPDGRTTVEANVIKLDRVLPAEIEQEAADVGLEPAGRATIPATRDYSCSEVVIIRA